MTTIIISSTFISEPLGQTLFFWVQQFQEKCEIKFTPYNQVFQQLTDPTSLSCQNKQGINVFLIRFEDWGIWYAGGKQYKNFKENLDLFVSAMESAVSFTQVPFIVCICPPANYLNNITLESFRNQEKQLVTKLETITNIHVLTSEMLMDKYYVNDYYNTYSNELGHVPYTSFLYTGLGTLIARKIYTIQCTLPKVIVVDCDDTLWKGVCAEVGSDGIEVSFSYQYFQRFLLEKREAGFLICLCSKNDEEDVLKVLNGEKMLLKLNHITSYKINWQPKSKNIIDMARDLNLGLDSFAFIDNNPVECAEVNSSLPEVITLLFPEDELKIPQFLKNLWLFDQKKITKEDKARSVLYLQERERENYRKSHMLGLKEFIKNLNLEIQILKIEDEDQVVRAAQLTQRTNQFNLTTIRRTEADIYQLLKQKEFSCYMVNAKDRFGDYGLIGVLIFRIQQKELTIDTLLLSCRVLGRGIEYNIITWLGKFAVQQNISIIKFGYKRTSRNQPALDFLRILGATELDSNHISFILEAHQAIELKFEPEKMSFAEPIVKDINLSFDNREKNAQLLLKYKNQNDFNKMTIELYSAELIQIAVKKHFRKTRKEIGINTKYISPKSDYEYKLSRIFEDVLEITFISLHDNFLGLGMNSLDGVQICSRVNEEFGVKLGIQDLFVYTTIFQLAPIVYSRQKEHYEDIKSTSLSAYPLSFSQLRIWFIHQLLSNKSVYNVSTAMYIKGRLDIPKLERAINTIIVNHQILSNVITVVSGEVEPRQTVKNFYFSLIKNDLRSKVAKKKEVDKLVFKESTSPFNLRKGPLIRGRIIHINEQEYLLLITMHHIISDECSWNIFYKELAGLYNSSKLADLTQQSSSLPIQYVDFAVWQRHLLSEKFLEKQFIYWGKQLSGAQELLNLPIIKPRSTQSNNQGTTYIIEVDKLLIERISLIGRQQNASLFMVLLSVFNILLYRYTNQEDIVIGTPIANRHYPGVQNLIGVFINTLALRTQVNAELTFNELLNQVREVALSAYAHQDLPFEYVVKHLKLKRDLSYHPLFQVMFVLKEKNKTPLKFNELEIEFKEIKYKASIFDLTLQAEVLDDCLKLSFIYNTDLFENKIIKQMACHFKNLLKSIIEYPNHKISKLPMLSFEEKYKLVEEWNKKYIFHHQNFEKMVIHKLFEKKASSVPNAIALIHEQKQLTYQELNQMANRLGHLLMNQYNLTTTKIVAISMDPGFEVIISFLAILKAGLAFLPIDPSYPDERIKFMLEDSKISILIIQSRLFEKFKNYQNDNLKLIIIDDVRFDLADNHLLDNNPITFVESTDLAYIIYTSGSTGKPKGVLIEHQGVCNLAQVQAKTFNICPEDRVLQFASISFDAAIWEWASALLCGATLCLLPSYNDRFSPEKLTQICNEYRITIATFPPSILKILPSDVNLPDLRVLIVAGEAPDSSILEKWNKKVKQLYNAYGPSEATVCTTIYLYDGTKPATTIGRPIDNLEVYILDKNFELVPIGVPGEIYIGGVSLAKGYLNQDYLTEKSFITVELEYNDTLNSKKIKNRSKKVRLYKTGDLAKYSFDANIEYLGRVDYQIKLYGHRIEPGEIEALINLQPEIKQSLVIERERGSNQKQLVAYLVAKNKDITEGGKYQLYEKIRDNLKKQLPSFMIPNRFLLLENFPLTPNNKIDRKALPPPPEVHHSAQDYEKKNSPKDLVEFELIKIWKNLIKINDVGIFDNFFTIGGDSISAMFLTLEIRKIFNQTIHISDFFKDPTIYKLSQLIRENISKSLTTKDLVYKKCLLPIQTKGNKAPLFLVHPSLGLAVPYLALSDCFIERPLYGISNPFFAQDRNFLSIDEMASFYIKAIRLVQSVGPYYLGGWSFGGIVALEMSRQLKTLGEQVEITFLIDSYHIVNAQEIEQEIGSDQIYGIMDKEKINQFGKNDDFKFEISRNLKLLQTYKIKTYEGRVVLLKARDTNKYNIEEDIFNNFLSIINPAPEICSIPGTHQNLLKPPNVRELASKIQYFTNHSKFTLILNKSKNISKEEKMLLYATAINDQYMVKKIITYYKEKINTNVEDYLGRTPLSLAIFNKNKTIENILKKYGATEYKKLDPIQHHHIKITDFNESLIVNKLIEEEIKFSVALNINFLTRMVYRIIFDNINFFLILIDNYFPIFHGAI